MKDADLALASLAAEQRGVFTQAQARDAGLTTSDVGYRVRCGLFVPCCPHTLRFAGASLDWRGSLMAGVLGLGDGALVSGRAAAALHGLDGFDEGPLEYLVQRSQRRRTANGSVRSTPRIEPLDGCTVDGLPVTSATFTIVQLIGQVTADELGNALDSATRKRLTAPAVVERRLDELGTAGRRGMATFNEVLAGAGVESWLERRFLSLIRRSDLPRPAIQRSYHSGGKHVARVDFDFHPLPIIVEVGGKRGYLSAADRQRQERRRNELQLLGKTVYFFTTEDVRSRAEWVVTTVRGALRLAA